MLSTQVSSLAIRSDGSHVVERFVDKPFAYFADTETERTGIREALPSHVVH